MKNLLFFFIISFVGNSQSEELQSIGTISTHMIYCPCKLLKYYEEGDLFYFCKDQESGAEYHIKIFQHKNGIDGLFKNINQKLFKIQDSLVKNQKINYLNDYISRKKEGDIISFMKGEAVLINRKKEKILFFSDEDFFISFELKVVGEDEERVDYFFNKSAQSVISKRQNLKAIFRKNF